MKLGKKAMEIPIHWLIIAAVLLVLGLLIIGGAYLKGAGEGGVISNLFSSLGR